jgi:hypothetical protein
MQKDNSGEESAGFLHASWQLLQGLIITGERLMKSFLERPVKKSHWQENWHDLEGWKTALSW